MSDERKNNKNSENKKISEQKTPEEESQSSEYSDLPPDLFSDPSHLESPETKTSDIEANNDPEDTMKS